LIYENFYDTNGIVVGDQYKYNLNGDLDSRYFYDKNDIHHDYPKPHKDYDTPIRLNYISIENMG